MQKMLQRKRKNYSMKAKLYINFRGGLDKVAKGE